MSHVSFKMPLLWPRVEKKEFNPILAHLSDVLALIQVQVQLFFMHIDN